MGVRTRNLDMIAANRVKRDEAVRVVNAARRQVVVADAPAIHGSKSTPWLPDEPRTRSQSNQACGPLQHALSKNNRVWPNDLASPRKCA
jgi:hypothetical protein